MACHYVEAVDDIFIAGFLSLVLCGILTVRWAGETKQSSNNYQIISVGTLSTSTHTQPSSILLKEY
jgi:hypothetical protein